MMRSLGWDGAQAWLDAEVVPHGQVVFGVPVDPTGRGVLPDFWPIVLIGLESAARRCLRAGERPRNTALFRCTLCTETVPVFASDHDRFFANTEPDSGTVVHQPRDEFYHTPGDVPETVDYRVLLANTQYIANFFVDFGNANRSALSKREHHPFRRRVLAT